ncbi:MAG: transposase [Kiritimatiellales bacterium]|nr:transposase [Kiritimatiellales bacterium]MCF7864219.1 transposase [Kiritimatiellales bacterium]
MTGFVLQKKMALQIVKTLQNAGFSAFFAGGCVRDELLGRKPKDYDVATNALPDEVEALFPKTLPIGKAFGVIAVVDGKETVEVATFRKETGTLDGRHPETVEFSAAKEDALRRDFTINGMFYDPIAGQLIDHVHGQRDLERKIIVAIGDPSERFREDHLRMLRAVRFAHNLGFALDPGTEEAIRNMAHFITNISAERIEAELSRTLVDSPKPGDALRHLYNIGLLQHILPELLPMVGQEQPPQFHPEGDVFEHTIVMLNLMNQHVGRTFQSAHPEDELAQNPFRPVEYAESLHTTHRRLPHWQQDSRIYFVTFRLADSIAQDKLNQWKDELEAWRKFQPDPGSRKTENEQARQYRKKQQEWLDQGHGSCLLKNKSLSEIVEQALLHFDGENYRLGDYVVMPNHVHAIVAPGKGHPLSKIMQSWKGYTAHEINKLLGMKGTVWMDESFDHIVRSESYFHKFVGYIRENPMKANLPASNYRLGKGSLQLNLATEGQTGKSAPHVEDRPVEQAFQPARTEDGPSFTPRELAYTVLLHDVGKPPTARIGPGTDGELRIRFDGHATVSAEMAEAILVRLRFPNKERKHIVEAIHGHMRFMDVQKMRTSKLRKMIGAETFDLEMELHRLDCLGSHAMLDNYDFLQNYMEEMSSEPILPEPWLRGHDLIAMGITEGKLIGKILREAYDAQMEDRFANRDALLDWVRGIYKPE